MEDISFILISGFRKNEKEDMFMFTAVFEKFRKVTFNLIFINY